jgi:hypothetical protein
MAAKVSLVKKFDLPPKGDRNADPLTDAAGAHPIETGIGAAAAGAAAGMAVGAFAGPVAAALGVAAGAIAGAYAGKSVGEIIDPTTEDTWLRDNFEDHSYFPEDDTVELYQPLHGYRAEADDAGFDAVVDEVEKDWAESEGLPGITWPRAPDAMKDGCERKLQLGRARDVPEVKDDAVGGMKIE